VLLGSALRTLLSSVEGRACRSVSRFRRWRWALPRSFAGFRPRGSSAVVHRFISLLDVGRHATWPRAWRGSLAGRRNRPNAAGTGAVPPLAIGNARRGQSGHAIGESVAPSGEFRCGGCLLRTRATLTPTRLTPGDRSANVSRRRLKCPDTEWRAHRVRACILVLVDMSYDRRPLNACAPRSLMPGARTVSYGDHSAVPRQR